MSNLGQVAATQGDYGRAEELLQESLALKRERGDQLSVAYTLRNVGMMALRRGHFAAARAAFDEGLRIGQRLDSPPLMAEMRASQSRLLAALSRPSAALELLAAITPYAAKDEEIMTAVRELTDKLKAELAPEEAAACQKRGKEMSLTAVTEQTLARSLT